ncbi:MAG TPA: hypothetical protein VM491_22285, partial [Burkholderiaceae bacterium]|nr:hypothetical protein [Burkholderiaceae bacterium]
MNRRGFGRALLRVAASGAAPLLGRPADAASSFRAADDPRFAFALIGDTPYGARERHDLQQVLARLDEDVIEFVVHVGDIKG